VWWLGDGSVEYMEGGLYEVTFVDPHSDTVHLRMADDKTTTLEARKAELRWPFWDEFVDGINPGYIIDRTNDDVGFHITADDAVGRFSRDGVSDDDAGRLQFLDDLERGQAWARWVLDDLQSLLGIGEV